MIGGPFQKGIRQGRILSTSTSSAASPVGRRTCSEGALSFSRPRLASGVAGIAGRLLFGLEGDVMGGLPGSASRAACSASAAASRATSIAWRAACRSANAGSFTPDLVRNFSSSAFFAFAAALSRSSTLAPFRLRISPHLCEDPSDGSGYGGKTTLGDDATLAGKEHRRPLHEPARPKGRSFDKSDRNKFRICHWDILPSLNFRHFVFVRRCA